MVRLVPPMVWWSYRIFNSELYGIRTEPLLLWNESCKECKHCRLYVVCMVKDKNCIIIIIMERQAKAYVVETCSKSGRHIRLQLHGRLWPFKLLMFTLTVTWCYPANALGSGHHEYKWPPTKLFTSTSTGLDQSRPDGNWIAQMTSHYPTAHQYRSLGSLCYLATEVWMALYCVHSLT